MKNFSGYQKKVISNYYDNLDTIKLNKLSEIVTELYLAETQKKTDSLWVQAEKAMIALKIPKSIIDNILAKRTTEILAKNLNEWLKKK